MTRHGASAAMLIAAFFLVRASAGNDKPVDPQTGLVTDEGFEVVKSRCTSCHSARLITQAGKTRQGWIDSIRWMQQTQRLWDLGVYENQILDYLSKNYGIPSPGTPVRSPVMPLPPPPD